MKDIKDFSKLWFLQKVLDITYFDFISEKINRLKPSMKVTSVLKLKFNLNLKQFPMKPYCTCHKFCEVDRKVVMTSGQLSH